MMSDELRSKRYEPPVIDLENKNSSHTLIVELTGRNKNVLEVGTSTGYISRILRERGNTVTGIEIDPEAGEIARQHCDSMIIGDIEKLDLDAYLAPSSFDVIIFGDVLEHLVSPEDVLKKVKKYLRPDGYLAVSLPNVCHGDVILNLLMGDFKYTSIGLLDATHLRFFGLRNIIDLFSRCGYSITGLHTTVLPVGGTEQRLDPGVVPEDLANFVKSLPNSSVYQYIFKASPSPTPEAVEAVPVPDLDDLFRGAIEGSIQAEIKPLLEELSAYEVRTVSLAEQVEQLTEETQSLQVTISERDAQIASLDGQVEQLTGETQSLQRTISERDAQVALLDEQTRQQAIQLMQLSNELASMKQSVVWRLTTMFHTKVIEKLLPISSKRRGTYDLFLKGSRVLVNDGWNSFWMSVKEYRGSKKETDNEYSQWIIANEPSVAELAQQRNDSQTFQYLPRISIITPVYNISPEILKNTLQSVIDQTYGNWELCLVDGNSENPEVKDVLKRSADDDPRILVTLLDENHGISGNSNIALSMATGEFVLFLDHDDVLAPFALFEIVKALNENPFLDVIYSDRDLLSEDGKSRYNPLFKPDWSPEIMLSANYLAHLCVIRRELLDTVGQFDKDVDGAQDWDLFLRVVEKTDKIYHIPKVLYHWRSVQTSCAERGESAKPYIVNAQQKVIQRHLERYNLPGRVTMRQPGGWHIQWTLPLDKLVSIIIPSKNVSLLKNCLESIFSLTAYKNYEIIVIDTGLDTATEPEFIEKVSKLKNVKIIEYKDPFNYSTVNNIGRLHAKGELLLFLNDDTLVISPDWLSEMVGWSVQDKIGVVGAKLLFSNGTIQHAGVILGLTGFAGHPFTGSAKHTMGMFGSTDWYRNYCAVTGACMMVRREVFDEVGGFDEGFILCGSDVEFCLRVRRKGYRIMYNPFATLKHLESVSRGSDIPESDFQMSCLHYTPILESCDPYFNPNLSHWNCIPTLRKNGEKRPIDFVREVVKK